jgi:hypothetical protein
VTPRPSDGFVHAHESPTVSSPLTTGAVQITIRRSRSEIPAAASIGVIGARPRIGACIGQALSSFEKLASSRSPRSA